MMLEIPGSHVAWLLAGAGVPTSAIKLADSFYALPSEQDIRQRLAESFTSILGQMDYVFKSESQDCDNFAMGAVWWAQHFHAERKPTPQSALAFGEIWCESKEHAFCFAVHRDGDRDYLAWYEPQISLNGFSLNDVPMTRADCESVWLAKA